MCSTTNGMGCVYQRSRAVAGLHGAIDQAFRWRNADGHVELLKLDAVDQDLAVPVKDRQTVHNHVQKVVLNRSYDLSEVRSTL